MWRKPAEVGQVEVQLEGCSRPPKSLHWDGNSHLPILGGKGSGWRHVSRPQQRGLSGTREVFGYSSGKHSFPS